jgi:DNA replication protein DnaC
LIWRRGYTVLFTTAASLLAQFSKARHENRLEDKLELAGLAALLLCRVIRRSLATFHRS